MSIQNPMNMAHSVHQRLLNEAKKEHRSFNDLMQYYAMERFLYRLTQTPHRNTLLLKGALLLRAWGIPSARPTIDIDMTSPQDIPISDLLSIVREIFEVSVDDGLIFHLDSFRTEPIEKGTDFQGIRILFRANLGNARVFLQMDVGQQDAVTPDPVWIELPSLLDFPPPRLLAYTPYSTIGEKFHGMVALGAANSRMKDYFDIYVLARNLTFHGDVLQAAILATFNKRGIPLPNSVPIGLAPKFSEDPIKQVQWNAFIKRLVDIVKPHTLEKTIDKIREFIMPPLLDYHKGKKFDLIWPPEGPWTKKGKGDGSLRTEL
ncbi:MAG: nucleotidyl transferase AbiEii/AbiGii toxin family protein [Candidatus Aminicenantes bacterium]|nr:nucleotidyl transferase AbiEii/AbiGii toxin family protein [Candidatus Aminicenantes bacterium]